MKCHKIISSNESENEIRRKIVDMHTQDDEQTTQYHIQTPQYRIQTTLDGHTHNSKRHTIYFMIIYSDLLCHKKYIKLTKHNRQLN